MVKSLHDTVGKVFWLILIPFTCLSQQSNDMSDFIYSKKKFADLIEKVNYQVLEEYSDQDFEAYLLEDGRLFLKDAFGGEATMYESLNEYLAVQREFDVKFGKSGGFHVLTNHQSEMHRLVNKDRDIIREYFKTFEGLTFEMDSGLLTESDFAKLDGLISAQKNHNDYPERNFIPIVAIVGAALIDRTQGKWILRLSKTYPQIVEPCVLGADGRLYNPWLNAYKTLTERHAIRLESLILAEMSDL